MIKKTFLLTNTGYNPLVLIALRYNRKRVTISTNVNVTLEEWDSNTNRVKGKDTDALIRNQRLARWEAATNQVILEMDLNKKIDIDLAKYYIMTMMNVDAENPSSKHLLLPFYDKWATTTTTKRVASKQMSYNYRKIKEFIGRRRITFSDVTIQFCEEYIEWLAAQNISANTRGTHIKNLKTVMQNY